MLTRRRCNDERRGGDKPRNKPGDNRASKASGCPDRSKAGPNGANANTPAATQTGMLTIEAIAPAATSLRYAIPVEKMLLSFPRSVPDFSSSLDTFAAPSHKLAKRFRNGSWAYHCAARQLSRLCNVDSAACTEPRLVVGTGKPKH